MARILLIDDEADLLTALTMILKSRGHEVTQFNEAVSAGNLALQKKFDLIISDIRMQPMDGLQLLEFLRRHGIETPVLMLTAHATLDTALQAMKQGAFDFITKPFNPEGLLDVVQKVLEQPCTNGSDMALDESVYKKWLWHGIIARSRQMQDISRSLERIAPTNESILFLGEEGTGKQFAARTLHDLSSRSKKEFLSFDCASVAGRSPLSAPDAQASLLMEQLEKNAGGTVLFENINVLSEQAGREFMQKIQSRTAKKTTGTEAHAVDARLLANCRHLDESIGWLRPLSAFTIALPPLRKRRDDILPLLGAIIHDEASPVFAAPHTISSEAYAALLQYDWPGNIDELRGVLAEMVKSAGGPKLTARDLPGRFVVQMAGGTGNVSKTVPAAELRGKSFRDYVRRKQMEIKRK